MNGFVGMNPEELKQRIEYIYQQSYDLIVKPMGEETINFFTQLRYEWFSPKAVEFYNNHADQIVATLNNITNLFYKECLKVADAYNIMAFANGLPTFEANLPRRAILKLTELSDNLNGNIGMDTISVQYDLDWYERQVRIKMNNFRLLPDTLPFYGFNSSENYDFRKNIEQLQNAFTEEFESLMKDINYAIQTEVRNTNVSRSKAFEALNIDVTKQERTPKSWNVN